MVNALCSMPAPVYKPVSKPAAQPLPEPVVPAPKGYVALTLFTSWLAKLTFLVWPLGEISTVAFHASSSALTPFCAWLGLLAFGLQVYLVASSSSDLVRGVAVLRGVEAQAGQMEVSYRSQSVTEFWNGCLQSFTKVKPVAWFGPVLVVLVALPSLGAGLSQVAWLAIMLLLLVIEQRVCGGRALWHRLPRVLRTFLTFAVIMLSWVFLRSVNMDHAMHYFGALAGRWDLTESALIAEARLTSDSNLLIVIMSLIIVVVLPPVQMIIEPMKRWKTGLVVAALALVVFSSTSHWASLMHRVMKRGSESVFAGYGGWLFDARELNALSGWGALQAELSAPGKPLSTAPQGVLDFATKLKERGVPLLLIPLPMKASIFTEQITGTDPDFSEAPLYHDSQPALYDLFTKAGIDVQDLTQAMLQLKERKKPVFLRQDSHWTPEAVHELAKQIAAYVKKKYPEAASDHPLIIDAKAPEGHSLGDLAKRLRLTSPLSSLSPETAVMVSFPGIANDPASPLALIGGSDLRIYDDPRLGFSDDGQDLRASFVQHLALYLGHPIDAYTQRDGHHAFARRLDDEVREKKLVIWIVPARDLLQPAISALEWKPVTFNPERRPPQVLTPMVPGAGK